MVRVKLFGAEAKEGYGYKLSVKSLLKSMYLRLVILERSFSGTSGNLVSLAVECGPGSGATSK